MERTWVCPRVKSAEPWVRGSNPTSQVTGLISSGFLPSTRTPSREIIFLTSSLMIVSKTPAISFIFKAYSSSPNFSWKYSWVSFLTSSNLASRSSFSGVFRAASSLGVAYSCTAATISASGSAASSSILGRPYWAAISSWKAAILLISSWPKKIASRITSSGTSLAPASTMMMASLVPATIRSKSLSLLCSEVGLITKWPSTRPTCTAATGPANGISERERATDAPIKPVVSEGQSGSTDNTVTTTWISRVKSFGKSGRIERSIARAARMALSGGLPSRRKKLPGIFPTE